MMGSEAILSIAISAGSVESESDSASSDSSVDDLEQSSQGFAYAVENDLLEEEVLLADDSSDEDDEIDARETESNDSW